MACLSLVRVSPDFAALSRPVWPRSGCESAFCDSAVFSVVGWDDSAVLLVGRLPGRSAGRDDRTCWPASLFPCCRAARRSSVAALRRVSGGVVGSAAMSERAWSAVTAAAFVSSSCCVSSRCSVAARWRWNSSVLVASARAAGSVLWIQVRVSGVVSGRRRSVGERGMADGFCGGSEGTEHLSPAPSRLIKPAAGSAGESGAGACARASLCGPPPSSPRGATSPGRGALWSCRRPLEFQSSRMDLVFSFMLDHGTSAAWPFKVLGPGGAWVARASLRWV